MSDIEPTEDEDQGPAALREALKRAEQRAKEAEERATAGDNATRENVMLRAGVDIDSKLGQMFARSYEGDLDVDAVKAEWSDLAPSPQREEPKPEEVQQQTERASLASESAAPGQLSDVHPHRAGLIERERLISEGRTEEEANVAFFDALFNAARDKDERIVFDPADWQERAQG